MMRSKSGRGTNAQNSRKIKESYIRRAETISQYDAPAHLDSIVISLHQAIDNWRYHGAPSEEVSLCLDAFCALWTVVERRESDE